MRMGETVRDVRGSRGWKGQWEMGGAVGDGRGVGNGRGSENGRDS